MDVLFGTPYEELLDIFARINTYTVKLNQQELFNTEYLGYFKNRVYTVGYRYVSYFREASLLTTAQITRMGEAELCADLLAALCGGVQTNKTYASSTNCMKKKKQASRQECLNFMRQ